MRSQLKKRTSANSVEIEIPVPADSDTPKFKPSAGYAKYVPERASILWTIGTLPTGKEYSMRARLGLPSVKATEVDLASSQPQSPCQPSPRMLAAAERKLDRPLEVRFEVSPFAQHPRCPTTQSPASRSGTSRLSSAVDTPPCLGSAT